MTTATQKIPSGYKQTEIGVIPADWRISSINDLGTIIDGDRGSNYPNGDDFSEYGYCLFLNAKNVTKNGFRFEDVQFIKKEKDAVLSKGKLKRGDIVLTTRGTVGNIAFFDKDIPHENIRINSGMVIIRIDAINGVTPDYYHKLTQSNLLTNQIDRLVFGSAQPQLTVKSIATFQFPVPTQKNEQKSIVITLSDADALIRKLEKLIEKKKNIKKGAMQELLTGKRRLPGFNDKWETKKLGEVAEFERGRDLPKSDMSDEGAYKCIHYGQLFTEYQELVSCIKSKTNSDSGRFYSKANDVLMPTSDVTPRGLATASCIKECGVILGGGILVIRFNKGYDGLYFSYFVSQNKSMVLKLVKGSTVFHLYASDIANLEVNFPGPDEQVAIASVLSDMDTEIEKLESQLTKYQNIKQGMMQTLLTGKIRLLNNG